MKSVFLTTLMCLSTLSAQAGVLRFKCDIAQNLKPVHTAIVVLQETSSEQIFFDSEPYQMKLGHTDGNYELQMFDKIAPVRHYATGNIRQLNDKIGISVWQREVLMHVNCQLQGVFRR